MSTVTTPVDTQRTLGELVAERPARARVFERRGIDYCCHGDRTLTAAATEAGIDLDEIATALGAVEAVDDVVANQPVPKLIDHIVAVHHVYLRDELPLLEALANKVATVHGKRHGELAEVARLVRAVRRDLEPHLDDEEDAVFPAIRHHLDSGEPLDAALIDRLRDDHEVVGALLAELRQVSRDFAVPADACASYRSLYTRLPELEADTFRHIHLENNVLFPALAS